MREGRDRKKMGKKKKRLMIIVATTSLPAVDRPNAGHWNAAQLCQNYEPQKTGCKKYGQKRTSNSRDFADLDKCRQGHMLPGQMSP